MSYRPLHIPFLGGQEEGVDSKLLPEGLLRSVRNLKLDRDGRMVRRGRRYAKSGVTPEGDSVVANGAQPGGFGGDSEVISIDTQLQRTVRKYVDDKRGGADVEVLSSLPGTLPSETEVEHIFAAEKPEVGINQIFPQAGVDAEGRLIFAYVQSIAESYNGNSVQIEIRDPETFHIIKSLRLFVSPAGFNINGMRLAVSKVSNRCIIWFGQGTSSGGNTNNISLNSIDTAPPYAVRTRYIGNVASPTFPRKTFDIFARPDADTYLSAFSNSSNSIVSVSELPFDGGFGGQSFYFDTQPLSHCSCFSQGADGRWWVGLSSDEPATEGDFVVIQGDWAGGAVTLTTVENPGPRPRTAPMFAGEARTHPFVMWNELPDPSNQGAATCVRAFWDPTALSFNNEKRIETHVHVTSPIDKERTSGTITSFHAASEICYYSPLDTVTTREAGGRVVLLENFHRLKEDYSFEIADTVAAQLARAGSHALAVQDGGRLVDYTPFHPAQYTLKGVRTTVYPLEVRRVRQDSNGVGGGDPTFHCLWAVTKQTRSKGYSLRRGEVSYPGGTIATTDGNRVIQPFIGGVNIYSLEYGALGTLSGIYTFSFVMEVQDSNGRFWRSAPSIPREIDATAGGVDVNIFVNVPLASPTAPDGIHLVFYVSDADGSILFRRESYSVQPGSSNVISLQSIENAPIGTEIVYSQSGEYVNDMPPSCRFLALSRSRVWAGGLERPALVQASKVLNEYRGIEWSNNEAWQVILPEACTGLAAFDDSCVAFTADTVYAIHGAGPNNAGIGSFSEPRLIPSVTGCIEPKSVIVDEKGVFFLSSRGIEFMSRGYSSPAWVGQPVRDVLQEYPRCMGGTLCPVDSTIRWLFVKPLGQEGDSIVIVWDGRRTAWYTFHYPVADGYTAIGTQRTLIDGEKQLSMLLSKDANHAWTVAEDFAENQEARWFTEGSLETGEIRVAGVQGWGFGRRAHVLGQFGGRDCKLTLQVAFEGEPFLPQDQYTWELTTDEYGDTSPVELELTLPVQRFSSVRFRLSWEGLDFQSSDKGEYTFRGTGMTIYFSGADEGPRLGSRSRG